MACLKVSIDGFDECGAFHRRDQMVEKALLVALKRRTRGGSRLGVQRAGLGGNTRGLQRGLEMGVDDLIGIGVAVVDRDLGRRQLMSNRICGE